MIFLLSTCFFNRFAADDYYFIGELNEQSPAELYHYLNTKWHGRWTSNFLIVHLMKLSSTPFFLFTYNMLSLFFLLFGIKTLINSVMEKFQIKMGGKKEWGYAVLALGVFFFCTINPGESWFWISGSVVYLWSTIACTFWLSLFFKKTFKPIQLIIATICCIYIGGSNEPMTIMMTLGCLGLITKKKHIKLVIISLAVLIGAFLINYLSQGTIKRETITPSLSVIDTILYSGYGTIKYLFFDFHKTFLIALFIGFPIYLLGGSYPVISQDFKPLKHVLLLVTISIGSVFINELIVVKALGGLAPDRAVITSSIIITGALIRFAFLLGNYHRANFDNWRILIVLNIALLIFLNTYVTNIHSKYAKSVDERIENLINSKTNQTIETEALKSSGYLYSGEISEDANYFSNQHLKKGLNLKNDVVLKTN